MPAAPSAGPSAPIRSVRLLVLTVLTGVTVAIVYDIFEGAVRLGLDWIWGDLLHTDENRLLVIPTALVLGFVYFSMTHRIDPDAPTQHGLGEAPSPTLNNFARTLFLGFLSLLAGASLGPEAVLVPASIIVGSWLGTKTMHGDDAAIKALGAAGLIALFTAFFKSFLIGMLALAILTKQGARVSVRLVVFAAVASGSSYVTLVLLARGALARIPAPSLRLSLADAVLVVVFIGVGWLLLQVLKYAGRGFDRLENTLAGLPWVWHAIAAPVGLGILFLLGGTLVEFTGNTQFRPLFERAAGIGTFGLLWILLVKLVAIAWSRSLHYRGGMIFPSLLACAVVVAIASLHVTDLNIGLGLIAVFIGMVIADRKSSVLF